MVWDAPTGAVRASFWPATVDEVRFVPKSVPAAPRRAGTRVETNKPTTSIVENGPYRFRRNPIYCMFLGRAGLAMGFNSAWIFATLAPFSLQNLFGCNLWDTDTHGEQPLPRRMWPARGSSPSAVAI